MLITQESREYYNKHKDNFTHVISIVCPDEETIKSQDESKHLVLKMWDVDKTLENQFRKYNPPGLSECLWAVNWAEDVYCEAVREHKDFRLLIHCDAGVSRSAAISLGVLWTLSGIYFKYPDNVPDYFTKEYINSRKQWCLWMLEVGSPLYRFIEGRMNPGVKPNQAVLKHYRDFIHGFPW